MKKKHKHKLTFSQTQTLGALGVTFDEVLDVTEAVARRVAADESTRPEDRGGTIVMPSGEEIQIDLAKARREKAILRAAATTKESESTQ
jgi:hypothetical protein